MRRPALALLVALLPAAPALAQPLACTRIGGESAPGVVEAQSYGVEMQGGRVATVTLSLVNGRTTTTALAPVRDDPARSMRMASFPMQNGVVSTAFNMVTVEPAGTVLIETWIRTSDSPADTPPRHVWYRLRCAAGTGGK